MPPGVHRVCEFAEGMALVMAVALAHAWQDFIGPLLTGITIVCSCIISIHGVYRLGRKYLGHVSNAD